MGTGVPSSSQGSSRGELHSGTRVAGGMAQASRAPSIEIFSIYYGNQLIGLDNDNLIIVTSHRLRDLKPRLLVAFLHSGSSAIPSLPNQSIPYGKHGQQHIHSSPAPARLITNNATRLRSQCCSQVPPNVPAILYRDLAGAALAGKAQDRPEDRHAC